MVSKVSFSSSLLFLFFFAIATGWAQSPRQHIDFDEGWKFHLGHAADPHRDFNYGIGNILSKTGDAGGTAIDMKFDDRGWAAVQLPHDWAVGLPFIQVDNDDVDGHGYHTVGALYPENSVGWYRKTFTVDRADSGKRFVLQFDGIYRDSKVWINNCYLGGQFSGYCGSSYDITDFLRFNAKNTIVVRVDATQFEGWFYEGAGIYRHAWLNVTDDVHLTDPGGIYVHTQTQGDQAVVTIESIVHNDGLQARPVTVTSFITDRAGHRLASGNEQPLSLPIDGSGKTSQTLTIPHPELWSLKDPYLYRATVRVQAGNKILDSVTVRFGIRTITIDKDKGLFLNGEAVKVQGVCCHQDHAGVGAALPDYLQFYRIGLLKEMGANAYRTSHNPPTPELLDACDSLGMLVLDETRLLNSGAEYGAEFENLVLRDRNHASVFMWSIGNEEYAIQATNWGKRIAQHQLLRQQELDPSRTATCAVNMGNHYSGVNEVIPVRGFNYNLSGLDGYHKDHPDQPVIGTEVASTVSTRGIYIKDTVNAYVPDYDSVYPPWASTAEQWWTIAAARPWMMGGFAWTGFDYRGEPTPFRWPDINSHFGIMDMCGFAKTVYYYYQSWWTDKDILHIAPHWNWKGKEGQPVAVWVNTNADNVELFLNGKSLGRKDMPKNGHLEWMVSYAPGKLEAVAYKKGRKITAVEETTGPAYQVVASPSKPALLADGQDAVVINLSVVDKKGRMVPDAGNLLHFVVDGNARIIGVGNGDPSSHEADVYTGKDWQRRLFNGQCQVILQSAGKETKEVHFIATGDGLQQAQISL